MSRTLPFAGVHHILHVYISSYEEMLKCWEEDAEKRLSFSQLVTVISTILEEMAGYLDLRNTPSA